MRNNKTYNALLIIILMICVTLRAEEEMLQISLDYPDKKSEIALRNEHDMTIYGNNSQSVEGKVRVGSFARVAATEKSYQENINLRKEAWERSVGEVASDKANEVFYNLRVSWSESEDINRHRAGLLVPVNEQWSFGFAFNAGFYHLDDGTDVRRAESYEGGVLAFYRYNTEVRFSAGLTGSYDGNIFGPSLRALAEYTNRSGVSFSAESRVWVPWTDNTVSVNEGGRDTGITLRGNLPLRKKLQLSFDFELDRYDVASSAFSSKSYEGMQAQAGARLGWEVWGVTNRRLPVSFISPDNFSPDSVNTNLVVYASILAGKYFDLPAVNLIPVTERRLDQRIGVDASFAFNSFSGLRAGAYTGYDPERKIDFFKLYGFYSGLIFQPLSQMKIYADFGMDSEVATGIAEGKTWYCGGGVNYKF